LAAGAIQHLRAGGVSLLLDTRGPRLPRIVHWGSDLGPLGAELLDNLATADIQAAVTNVPDDPVRPGIATGHPDRARDGMAGVTRAARAPGRAVVVHPVHRHRRQGGDGQ
jgi:hypothetical protein